MSDLRGVRFGALVVLDRLPGVGRSRWQCRCDCGELTSVLACNLKHDHTKSCGCARRNAARSIGLANTRHGMHTSPEYRAWQSMIRRCESPSHPGFAYWGGRGIKVYDQWRASFDVFLADMGRRPSKTHSLDRINNDGNYEPGNCRWATKKQQVNNRRCSIRMIEARDPVERDAA